jgi:tRNA-dihydrouridine synthase B
MHSLSIGPIPLPNPVLLAPMSGVTDAPFRRLAASLGAGLVAVGLGSARVATIRRAASPLYALSPSLRRYTA